MLLQPKQMLAQVFEGWHRADPTTASASSWQCLTTKGNEVTRVSLVDARGQCLLDELVKPESTVVNYRTRSLAQTFLTSLSFRAAALSHSACCTGPFRNPLVCIGTCCIPLSVKNAVLAVWLQWPTLSVQSAAQCPWGYQAEPLPFCSVPGKVLLQINDTQYKLLLTAGYKIRWSP